MEACVLHFYNLFILQNMALQTIKTCSVTASMQITFSWQVGYMVDFRHFAWTSVILFFILSQLGSQQAPLRGISGTP